MAWDTATALTKSHSCASLRYRPFRGPTDSPSLAVAPKCLLPADLSPLRHRQTPPVRGRPHIPSHVPPSQPPLTYTYLDHTDSPRPSPASLPPPQRPSPSPHRRPSEPSPHDSHSPEVLRTPHLIFRPSPPPHVALGNTHHPHRSVSRSYKHSRPSPTPSMAPRNSPASCRPRKHNTHTITLRGPARHSPHIRFPHCTPQTLSTSLRGASVPNTQTSCLQAPNGPLSLLPAPHKVRSLVYSPDTPIFHQHPGAQRRVTPATPPLMGAASDSLFGEPGQPHPHPYPGVLAGFIIILQLIIIIIYAYRVWTS